jgi:hypothetical protein
MLSNRVYILIDPFAHPISSFTSKSQIPAAEKSPKELASAFMELPEALSTEIRLSIIEVSRE